MQKHRLGPHRGLFQHCRIGHILMIFHRRSRWAAWAVREVQWQPVGMQWRKKPPTAWGGQTVKKIVLECKAEDMGYLFNPAGLEKFPAILSFLSDRFYVAESSVEPREPGTIYVSVREGQLQVTLKEPSQALLARIAVPSWSHVLPYVEAALNGPASLWESDPWRKAPRKKK